ncbi:tetratricopeptide repeat protein [Lentzea sp. CC55]|uniref:ATP-binding protein n=1 Tax=Lentzea sp. CC55 TaxID=2884909 RepID=UPI001F3C4AB0|nr:tetratricopeptide repeat protein [Lentzea sp. CC55]MCG8924272.1 tetratricopeptide repeat protein [Lentzea sp. CC55]
MSKETRQAALHRALRAKAGQPVLFGDLVRAVWGDEAPARPLPALRTLVRRLRRSVDDEIVTDASGYRLVVRAPGPAQLPADLPDFVGREDELTALSTSTSAVLAITGPPGVGKTALAVKLAHRIRDRFPDGQLHVDLRGFAVGPAVGLDQALGRFLRALGVPPANVPPGRDEQIALYRSKLRGRKVLVLLDNATELSPLVPGVEGCTAIVTSRNELPGQTGLAVLADDEAGALLDRMGVDGSPDDRAELIRLCAHLPLALRIAGAHLADRHLPDYLDELRGDGRLDALEIEGDAAVRAAFALSHKALPDDARHLFGLLSVHPGADFDVEDTAALADLSIEDAARLLDVLVGAGLVQRAEEQFVLHDLIRLFASEQAGEEAQQALHRLLSYYTATASQAAEILVPAMTQLQRPALAVPGRRFATAVQARGWLDAKRAVLVAAVQVAPHPFACHLADALRGYLNNNGYRPEQRVVLAAGLASARSAGDRAGETAMLNGTGQLHWRLGAFAEALRFYDAAVELAASDLMKGTLLSNAGLVKRDMGDFAGALADLERARRLSRSHPALHVNVVLNLGTVHGVRAELRKAAAHFEEAWRLAERHASPGSVAAAREGLGVALIELGRYEEARPHLESALAGYREVGRSKPNLLVNLADLTAAAGRDEEARTWALRCLELAQETGDTRVQVEALIRLGDQGPAVALAEAINYPLGRRRAQLVLARTDPGLAEELLRDVRDSGDLLLESRALLALAEATADPDRAREALDTAKAREQAGVVAEVEAFLAAQPPANGGSTSS